MYLRNLFVTLLFSKIASDILSCNASYGAIRGAERDLQVYANAHVTRSFEYLLMATHFGNYEKNREGFQKLFTGLSDNKWEKAIELIKYITKRGGKMDFANVKDEKVGADTANLELYELQSLSKALDIEKQLATEAHRIHGEVTRRNDKYHDPEISSYLEEEFVHEQADIIRKLSGYTTDLSKMLSGKDRSLSLYMFCDYLGKQSIV